LEKFYNENCEKFLLNAAYEEYLENQKEKNEKMRASSPAVENIPNNSDEIQLID